MITEEQIWGYLDGNLTGNARKELEQTIATDKHAADLFEEISTLHAGLKTSGLMKPSAMFTDRVMSSIRSAPGYAPVSRFTFKPWLIFALPVICAITAFAVLLAYNHVSLSSYRLPVKMPDFKNYQIYFVVADLLLLAYFVDRLSEYRFNRKALFAK